MERMGNVCARLANKQYSYMDVMRWLKWDMRATAGEMMEDVTKWLLSRAHAADFYQQRYMEFDKLARILPEPFASYAFGILANGIYDSALYDTMKPPPPPNPITVEALNAEQFYKIHWNPNYNGGYFEYYQPVTGNGTGYKDQRLSVTFGDTHDRNYMVWLVVPGSRIALPHIQTMMGLRLMYLQLTGHLWTEMSANNHVSTMVE